MNFTAKSRYALKIMMDLASMHDEGQQTRLDISRRHGIPIDFMDQILARLKSAGLIQTTRGRAGGISLSMLPANISLWQIFKSVEENPYPVQCLEVERCSFDHDCISRNIWTTIFSGIQSHLESLNLQFAVNDFNLDDRIAPYIIQECKAPKRTAHEQIEI